MRPGSDRDVVAQVFHLESYSTDALSRGEDVTKRYERVTARAGAP